MIDDHLQRGLTRLLGVPALARATRAGFLQRRVHFHLPLTALAERATRRAPAPAPTAADPFTWRAPTGRAAPAHGPLGGAAVAVKDSLAVAGSPSTGGTAVASAPADADALLVARIRAGGGDILGTTQMTELGVNGFGAQPHHGTLDNPASPGFVPGGSSSGTAVALARGLARYGVGTDALGSVRIPAAFCGLVGLKPSHDLALHDGYASVARSLDMPGPMAASVADVATLWQVMADRPITEIPPASAPIVGLLREHRAVSVDAALRRAVSRALDAVGARRVALSVPGARRASLVALATASYELSRDPAATLSAPSPDVAFARALGAAMTSAAYERLMAERAELRQAVVAALSGCDVLAMPTTAVLAPRRTASLMRGVSPPLLLMALGAFTPLANATGLPAIAVPAGRASCGRACSIMFVGRPGEESTLLAVAGAVEASGV